MRKTLEKEDTPLTIALELLRIEKIETMLQGRTLKISYY
jgi:hypothetical protein